MSTAFNRRTMLRASSAAAAITLLPVPASAQSADMRATIARLFGTRKITPGGVNLTVPPIAENGYSVPLSVSVDSPMRADDYVRRIAILSERNPIALIADFALTPASGRAHVESRVRLGGTQIITAVAEFNDGRLLSGTAKAVVTLAACVVL